MLLGNAGRLFALLKGQEQFTGANWAATLRRGRERRGSSPDVGEVEGNGGRVRSSGAEKEYEAGALNSSV